MNANNSKNPYPWLTGPVGETDAAAWDTYLKALREQLQSDWLRAKGAYLALKKVRESLGLPFIDDTPQTESGGPSAGAWTSALDAEAQDIQAMTTLITSALDDAISGKRKVLWDQTKSYFVIESLPEDLLRLELDAQGIPRMVDVKTGAPTHVTGTIGVPTLVWAATVTTSVLALPAYFIADAAVNGLRVVAEQKTIQVIGVKAFDCVQSGKCTPEQAIAITQAPYEGAKGVREAAAKEAAAKGKPESDFMKAVTTLGWVALGLGVIYAAVRFIPPIGSRASAPLLPAHSNPTVTRQQIYSAHERAKRANKKYQRDLERLEDGKHGRMTYSEHWNHNKNLHEQARAADHEVIELEKLYEKQHGRTYWQHAA